MLTIVGILWISNKISLENNNLGDGILAGLLVFVIIYGFSRILIPDLIEKGDKFIKEHTDLEFSYEMHKYIIGFFLVILICLGNLSVQNLYKIDKGVLLRRQIKV